jgi:hypothetical protein
MFVAVTAVAFAESADSPVYVRFKNEINILEARLVDEPNPKQRYALFLSTFQQLGELRTAKPRLPELQELDMSFFMETLSYLPTVDNFNEKRCPDYKRELRTMFTAYDGSKEPFVESALGVLDLICR